MESSFDFLDTSDAELLNEILARRSSRLLERVRRTGSVSRSDAQDIMTTVSDEFSDNLDNDWEPTDYGKTVSDLLAKFNAARINEWP